MLCALLAAAVAVPATSHAQFGRLRDAATAAARGAVERGAEQRAGEAVARKVGGGDEARPANVAFTEGVLEITEARLDQLVRGLDAESAARPAIEQRHAARVAAAREAERTYPARRAAWERAHADWARRKAVIDACIDKAMDRHAAVAKTRQAESEAIGAAAEAHFTPDRKAQLKALGDRARAAQARGDQAALMAIADSVQRITRNEIMPLANASQALADKAQADSRVLNGEAKACGAMPPEPKAPTSGGFVDASAAVNEARQAGRVASGLDEREYEVLRERVEEYVRLNGRTRASSYRYTAGELGVLGKRLDALKSKSVLLDAASWTPGGQTGS
jgi:hypothetical protein